MHCNRTFLHLSTSHIINIIFITTYGITIHYAHTHTHTMFDIELHCVACSYPAMPYPLGGQPHEFQQDMTQTLKIRNLKPQSPKTPKNSKCSALPILMPDTAILTRPKPPFCLRMRSGLRVRLGVHHVLVLELLRRVVRRFARHACSLPPGYPQFHVPSLPHQREKEP